MLPLWARMDLGAMAMKGYSAFPKAPASLEPHQRLFSVISRTLVEEGLTPLQSCSQCILQLQLTKQRKKKEKKKERERQERKDMG